MRPSTGLPISGGATQSGLRDYNAKLLLSLLREHGPCPGSDLARMTSLSAQTVSVILRSLERDGFLTRGEPVRGKVGKPSVPMSIRGDAAWSFGLKIGRRTTDIALMNLKGRISAQQRLTYLQPKPDQIFEFVKKTVPAMLSAHPDVSRLSGIGAAVPYQIWRWHEDDEGPDSAHEAWASIDLEMALTEISTLPVQVSNDATAACRAEHHFGCGHLYRDYAYFFVGAFIGGGIVLNRRVVEGNLGNAGALGSLVCSSDGQPVQLLDIASLHVLEAMIREEGGRPDALWSDPTAWQGHTDQVKIWIANAGRAIAQAAISACAVVDFEAVIIDGAFPPEIRTRLTAVVKDELDSLDTRGLLTPVVSEGHVGANARVIGAAYAPLSKRYFLDAGPMPGVTQSIPA